MAFGKQMILMQRVKDISTRGSSKIAIPKTGKTPAADKLHTELPKVEIALLEQEELLRAFSLRISHTARLAERLLKNGDTTMTVATMRKIKSIQQEYVHVLRVVAALKEYETYIGAGLLSMKNVSKDIETILSAHWNTKPAKCNDTEVLSQVAAKQFFPTMNASGAIAFSDQSSFAAAPKPEANTLVNSAA
ncbi:MAG: hypothetical protein SGBAC_010181 [Bacillariaceae sp.]